MIFSRIMQVLKADIRQRLLREAGELFLEKGFLGTSMREISDAAQVGLSNVYHYFPSKDALFLALVQPAITALETIQLRHHGPSGHDATVLCSEDFNRKVVDEYYDLLTQQAEPLRLLFFRAAGSSLESYRQTYTDQSSEQVLRWFSDQKKRHPDLHTDASGFFIRISNVWFYTLLEETVRRGLAGDELRAVLEEYVRYNNQGWRSLMGI